jgi:uncharacterized DUF497 family protein
MVDLDRVEGFDWDEGNARKSSEKHGVSQAESESVFFRDPLIVVPDPRQSQIESRFHVLGQTSAGRQLHVVFTLRRQGTLIRVISARDMNRKERVIYAKEKEANS